MSIRTKKVSQSIVEVSRNKKGSRLLQKNDIFESFKYVYSNFCNHRLDHFLICIFLGNVSNFLSVKIVYANLFNIILLVKIVELNLHI